MRKVLGKNNTRMHSKMQYMHSLLRQRRKNERTFSQNCVLCSINIPTNYRNFLRGSDIAVAAWRPETRADFADALRSPSLSPG